MSRQARQGWEWTVLPSHSDEPMVACGINSLEAVSRLCVEDVMARIRDAMVGFLDHPGGEVEQCRRTLDGGLKWMPLFDR